MNRLVSTALAAAVASGAIGAGTLGANAEPWHHGGWHGGGWQGDGGWHHGGGGWHGGGWHHQDNGAALAAGIGGLALGAIAGSALASPNYDDGPQVYYDRPVVVERVYPVERVQATVRRPVYEGDHVTVCLEHYRSYDPRSDTFLGNDGYRHRCNL